MLRAGRKLDVAVTMTPAPETTPRAAVKLKNRSPFSGATAWNVSPAVTEELGVEAQQGAVVVADVESGSPAEDVGLQKGDVVVAINDQKIATTKEFESATAERKRYWKITIERGGQVFTSVVGG